MKLTERIYRGWEHYPEDGIYPLVASASFASVYYLKALLIFRSPVFELEDSEDLLILFENLPQVDQDAIKDIFEVKVSIDLQETMKKDRHTIKEWRDGSVKDVQDHWAHLIQLGHVLSDYVHGLG